MANNDQYRALFLAESEEHIQQINNAILELEKNPADTDVLNNIFRSAHTLKGMSATMGFDSLARMTHKMEDVLDRLRGQPSGVTTAVVDQLFECLDLLEALLEEIKSGQSRRIDVEPMISRLEALGGSAANGSHEDQPDRTRPLRLDEVERDNLEASLRESGLRAFLVEVVLAADCPLKTVRVFMIFNNLGRMGEVVKCEPSLDELEAGKFENEFSLLLQSSHPAEEIRQELKKILEVERIRVEEIADLSRLAEKPAVRAAAAAVPGKEDSEKKIGIKKIQSIRISTERVDKLMNIVGELAIAKIRLLQLTHSNRDSMLSEILVNIDRLTGELQDEVMKARLVPIAHVFDRFPRMVRDLARSEKKQINLEIAGGDIELDRTVLDEVAEPLVHLLRNCIDHGIELPDERKTAGKDPVGLLRLNARRERTFVLVRVEDDGRGIDPAVLRRAALEKRFMGEEELSKMTDREVLQIITLPGFSSVSQITDTSGRGVGMDVVKMKIESLGGSLEFSSVLGQGSWFELKLPLTVAIIRAMLVKVGSEIYAIPIANIAETVKVSLAKIKKVEKQEVITLRNEVLPLIRMRRLLNSREEETETPEEKLKDISVVVVEIGGKKAGLIVDLVRGQQEVVIKPIGSLLKGIKGFAGATILGDGQVALILDVATLIGR